MRSLIVGTAGHIDHGKTALVRALTGIDTDRLQEEKRRGITIELGFAHLVRGETMLGIVDVPGHERFIKSMVAGAGGIDLVLLVVAADEGVMPQTREHLDICQLLGVRHGLVALTKVDLVDADWRALVEEDLRGVLAGTFLDGARVIGCSALTAEGIDELERALLDRAAELRPRAADGLMRLPLDRVFTIKGFGTVVTGTLIAGQVQRGEEVEVLPGGVTATVRRLQVHGEELSRAVAGQRTAINLGGVDRQAVARGEVVAHAGTLAASSMIDVELRLLESARHALRPRAKVLFHLGTRQQEASCALLAPSGPLQPGATALAQLRFEDPVVALPGDRFIVRGFVKQENHGTTIGGGEVIRVLSPRMQARNLPAVELLSEIAACRAEPASRVALEILAAGSAGIPRADLQQRLPLPPRVLAHEVQGLLDRGRILLWESDSGSVIHGRVAESLRRRMLEVVDDFHRQHPLKPGIGKAELRSRLPGNVDGRLFGALLAGLQQQGQLVSEQEYCLRPDHRQQVDEALGPLAERIAARYLAAGLGPPREAELEAELAEVGVNKVRAALKVLAANGTLVRAGPLRFHVEALSDLERRLRGFLAERGSITPGEFKQLVGQSRKYTIPLAEYFDEQRVTIRAGDLRRLNTR